MDKFVIKGGRRLTGEVTISGAKNAAVAILPAVILSDEPCVIENVPSISDVTICLRILSEMGAVVTNVGKEAYRIDPTNINKCCVPYETARKMRASYYFLGALLGRFNRARVSMPGGCPLGARPIDQHLKAFSAMGAKYNLSQGMIDLTAESLNGSQIFFDVVSVGATMNAMLAAVKANGLTVIENAAKEPHVVDLANFLNSMGANIMGAGTDVIKIRGVQHLHGSNYTVIPDQIEAGTFMVAIVAVTFVVIYAITSGGAERIGTSAQYLLPIASVAYAVACIAAATKGDAIIKSVIPKHLEPITKKMEKIGVCIEQFDDSIHVWVEGPLVKANIKTAPHPGFPTDMQSQIATLLTLAEGTSVVTENIWEQRFGYVDELRRMGADITVNGKIALIEGTRQLMGAPVKACDLRAGAALIIAGLAASGVTEIEDIYHIERGYYCMDGKLRALGADIEKVNFPDTQSEEDADVKKVI